MISHPGHKAQYAAGLLETLDGCPLIIQEMEKLRVDRVTIYHFLLIGDIFCLHGEVTAVGAIHLAESRTDRIPGRFILAWQKEPSSYDFKTLVGCHRLPNGFHAPESMLNLRQNLLSGIAAYLDFRLRQGGNHHTAAAGAGSLGKFLDKRNKIIEGAGRESTYAINFLGIGH